MALGALSVALTGCGDPAHPLRQVTHAAGKTLSLPGVGYTVTFARPTLFGRSVRLLGGKAVYDLRSGIGYQALGLRLKDGSARTLFLDFLPTAFLIAPVPSPSGILPAGKSWISVSFGPNSPRSYDSLAAQAAGLAPELALDEVAWGARSVVSTGSSVLGHVPTSEYLVSVDLAKALSAARKGGRPGPAAAIADQLRAAPSGRIMLKVWVNGPGYVARIDAPVPGSGLGVASFLFTSFNAGFQRSRPLPAQTVAFESLSPSRSLWADATAP